MNKTNIDWCDYTWNPVVGCKRGCSFCYAKELHNKRYKAYLDGKLQNLPQYAKPFEEIQFFPERLEQSFPKKPSTIFVGSMSDPEYWDMGHFKKIIEVCKKQPQHTFMFLTKNWGSYCNFDFPTNVMLGLTVTFKDGIDCLQKIYGFVDIEEHKKFLSIEPLLGYVGYQDDFDYYDMFIVGAMTGKNAIIPKPEWIQSIKDNVPRDKIFWKNNIKKYL